MKSTTRLTVGVEVEGGRIVPVLDASAQVRAHAVFTTSADHQQRADIRIYYREGEGGDWQEAETLVVGNIADCRAGEPDIDFYAEKAADGSLIVKTQALTPAPVPVSTPARHPRGKTARYLLLLSAAAVLALGTVFLLRLAAPTRSAAASELLVRPDAGPAGRVQATAPAVPTPTAQLEPTPAQPPAQPELVPAPGGEREYQVQWGDTLWRISESFYGDRSLYPQLAERNLLPDPDLIISGQSLVLPPELGTSLGRKKD